VSSVKRVICWLRHLHQIGLQAPRDATEFRQIPKRLARHAPLGRTARNHRAHSRLDHLETSAPASRTETVMSARLSRPHQVVGVRVLRGPSANTIHGNTRVMASKLSRSSPWRRWTLRNTERTASIPEGAPSPGCRFANTNTSLVWRDGVPHGYSVGRLAIESSPALRAQLR